MKFKSLILVVCISVSPFSYAVPFEKEVEARQSFMEVLKFYMTILGEMTKEMRKYDAELANTLAENLNSAALMDNSIMWPKGSDYGNRRVHSITDAKEELWTDEKLMKDKYKDWQHSTEYLKAQAGGGLDSLRKGFTAVAAACTSCHESFRVEL